MIPVEHVTLLSAALFTIGALTALMRRNAIAVLMALQIMLAGACLAAVGFNRMWASNGAHDGQLFVAFALIAAVSQLAIGLAIVLAFFRTRASVNVDDAGSMRW